MPQSQVRKLIAALKKNRQKPNSATPDQDPEQADHLFLDDPEMESGSFTPRERSPSSPTTESEDEFRRNFMEKKTAKKQKKYDAQKKLRRIMKETKHKSVTLVENTQFSRVKTREHLAQLLGQLRKATQDGHLKKITEPTVADANRLLTFWSSDEGKLLSDTASRLFQGPYLQISHNLVREYQDKTESMKKRLPATANAGNTANSAK